MSKIHEANRRHWNDQAPTWEERLNRDGRWRRCHKEPELAFEGETLATIREMVGDLREDKYLRPDLPFQGRDIRYQAVILKDHHVLLLRIEDEGKAVWVIPGGGREGSESEEECVRREVWEETHLRVEVERLILDEKVPQDPFYERHKTYLCQIIGGVAEPGIEPERGDAASPIKNIGWFDLRAVDSWDALGPSPPFAFSLLKRIREKLGYARETLNIGVRRS